MINKIVTKLLKQIEANDTNSEKTELDLIHEIVSATSAKMLENGLLTDEDDYLPVLAKIILMRRLVELERTEKNLRQLAIYLLLHGPIWDNEANQLLEEADSLKEQ